MVFLSNLQHSWRTGSDLPLCWLWPHIEDLRTCSPKKLSLFFSCGRLVQSDGKQYRIHVHKTYGKEGSGGAPPGNLDFLRTFLVKPDKVAYHIVGNLGRN